MLHRGRISRELSSLIGDFKGVLSPNTASKLRVNMEFEEISHRLGAEAKHAEGFYHSCWSLGSNTHGHVFSK